MTVTALSILLGSALIIARVHGAIRWPWAVLTAPLWFLPVVTVVVSFAAAFVVAGGVTVAVEMVRGKRAAFWSEGMVER